MQIHFAHIVWTFWTLPLKNTFVALPKLSQTEDTFLFLDAFEDEVPYLKELNPAISLEVGYVTSHSPASFSGISLSQTTSLTQDRVSFKLVDRAQGASQHLWEKSLANPTAVRNKTVVTQTHTISTFVSLP